MRLLLRPVWRAVVTGTVVGAVGLGTALAATVTTPVPLPGSGPADVRPTAALPAVAARPGAEDDAEDDGGAPAAPGERLPGGWFTVGSSVRSLVPPADRLRSAKECAASGQPEQLYTPLTPEGCLITFDMRWVDGVDEQNPLQARALAISNGASTVVFTVLDLVGYMAAYPADLCADCGIAAVTASLSQELGIPAQNLVVSSSHTHASPSTIAKGGAWYYAFVRDQVKSAVRAAVADLADSPRVRLETGATRAKEFNVDRRIKNRAVPDDELGWLRAFVPGRGGQPDRTVATVGNFAVHPTVRNANARLHSGIVGPFTRRVSELLGGATVYMSGAIGDQTPDKGFGINGIGIGLAERLVDDVRRGGHVLESNDIEVAASTVQVPVENSFFTAALASGYAVRDILPPFGGGPLAVSTTNGGTPTPVCQGAGSTHVVTPVSAVRLGARPPAGKRDLGPEYRLPVETDDVVLVQTPGEVFASIGLIAKDYLSRSSNVLVQGLANDTLGYIIPANQYDEASSQGAGLVHNALETGNYEEGLSLGRCTGEIVLNGVLEAGQQLGVMGEGEGR